MIDFVLKHSFIIYCTSRNLSWDSLFCKTVWWFAIWVIDMLIDLFSEYIAHTIKVQSKMTSFVHNNFIFVAYEFRCIMEIKSVCVPLLNYIHTAICSKFDISCGLIKYYLRCIKLECCKNCTLTVHKMRRYISELRRLRYMCLNIFVIAYG